MLPYYGPTRAGDTQPEVVYEYVFEAIRHGIGNTLASVYDVANKFHWDTSGDAASAAQRLRRLLSHVAKFSSSSLVLSRMIDQVNYWLGVVQHIYPVTLNYDPFLTMAEGTPGVLASNGSLAGSLYFILPAEKVFHVRIHHELTRVLDTRYMTTTQGFTTNYKHAIEGFVPNATLATTGQFQDSSYLLYPRVRTLVGTSLALATMDSSGGYFAGSGSFKGPVSASQCLQAPVVYDSPNVTKNPASLILSNTPLLPAELDGYVAHSTDPAYGYVTEASTTAPVYTQTWEDEVRVSTFVPTGLMSYCYVEGSANPIRCMIFSAGLWDVEGSFLHVAKEAGGTNYNQWTAEVVPNTGTSDAYVHPSVSLVTHYTFTPMSVQADVDLEIPHANGDRIRSKSSSRPLLQLGAGVSYDPEFPSEQDQRARDVGDARHMAMPDTEPHAAVNLSTNSMANSRPVSAPFRRK